MVRDEANAFLSFWVLLLFCNGIPMQQQQKFPYKETFYAHVIYFSSYVYVCRPFIAISFRKEVKHILPSHPVTVFFAPMAYTQQTNRIECVPFWGLCLFSNDNNARFTDMSFHSFLCLCPPHRCAIVSDAHSVHTFKFTL